MTRFAATVTLVLALTGASAAAALADAPALQRAADRIAAANDATRTVEHANPQSTKARHVVSRFVMIDEPRDTAPFYSPRFVMLDEPRDVAPFNLPR
jgi:hypothetical protein